MSPRVIDMDKVKVQKALQDSCCSTCRWAEGLTEDEECHPPTDQDCPANK